MRHVVCLTLALGICAPLIEASDSAAITPVELRQNLRRGLDRLGRYLIQEYRLDDGRKVNVRYTRSKQTDWRLRALGAIGDTVVATLEEKEIAGRIVVEERHFDPDGSGALEHRGQLELSSVGTRLPMRTLEGTKRRSYFLLLEDVGQQGAHARRN